MASKKMTGYGYKAGGEKLFKALAGKMGKDKSMSILQTMAAGGESLDMVEMVEKKKYGSETKMGIPKKSFGGMTNGSRTYSGK